MRLLIGGLALALMTASAQAQMTTQSALPAGAGVGEAADAASRAARNKIDDQKPKANDSAYNAALRNLPNKQYDPWHGVR